MGILGQDDLATSFTAKNWMVWELSKAPS